MRFLSFLFLLIPFVLGAQVEKVRTLNHLHPLRLYDGYSLFNSVPEDEAISTGSHVVYRARLYRTWIGERIETWVIDSTGSLSVLPDLGKIIQLDESALVSTGGNRLARFDPHTLTNEPLFSNSAQIFGEPQNGKVLALVEEGVHKSLWAIDGHSNGNLLLLDTVQIPFAGLGSTPVRQIYALNGVWVFFTTDFKMYRSDGTTQGTRLIHSFSNDLEIIGLTPQYVICRVSNVLWRLDYITGEFKSFWNFPVNNVNRLGFPSGKGQINGKVLFRALLNNNTNVLYSTDGTTSGTRALSFVPSISVETGKGPDYYYINNEAWYLSRSPFDEGGWKTDGTPAGTRRFADPDAGPYHISNVTAWGENRYMIASFGKHKFSGLWMLTEQGLKDCTPGGGYGWGLQEQDYFPQWVRPGKRHVYYQAHGPGTGRELYRTDEAGNTSLAAELSPGFAWSDVVPIGQAGDWFYFILNHEDGGASLYRILDDAPAPPARADLYEWQQTILDVPRARHYDTYLRPMDLATGQEGGVYAAGVYTSPYGVASGLGRAYSRPDLNDLIFDHSLSWHYSYYLARIDSATGDPKWLMTLGNSPESSAPLMLSPAPGNGVYTAAQQGMASPESPLRIGHQVFYPGVKPFFARIDSAGQARWVLTADSRTAPTAIKTDKSGHLITGVLLAKDSLHIGNQMFSPEAGTRGPQWGLAKIDPEGAVVWAKTFTPLELPGGQRKLQSMAVAPDNRVYLLFINNDNDSPQSQCDDHTSVQAELWCFSPEGRKLWQRALNPGGSVVASDMAVDAQGFAYLCGFAKGKVQFGSLAPQGDCDIWRDFVLILNREGFPVSLRLNDDEEDSYAYRIALDGKGRYALAGVRGAWARHIPYPGYAGKAPHGDLRFREFFLRYHTTHHDLMDEKRWNVYHPTEGPIPLNNVAIALAPLQDNHFAYMHQYGGPLDTFAHSPVLWPMRLPNVYNFGSVLMRLYMQEAPLPPPLNDAPLRISDIEVFPNPATHWLSLRSAHTDFKQARLYLFNSLGQELRLDDVPAYGPYRYLDVSALPAGVYYLGIITDGRREVKKVVLHR